MHHVISYPDVTLFKVVGGLGSRLYIVIPNRLLPFMFLFCV